MKNDETQLTQQTCRCGVESPPYKRTCSIGDIADATGFGFVWNISNGLEAIWLCPQCFQKVATAWQTIVDIAGTSMINMSGMLRQQQKRENIVDSNA